LMPVNRPGLPQRLYTPEKSKEAKAMTIAVGFYCGKGDHLIIAADRQFTSPGFHKYHRKKYVNEERALFGLTFVFAGDPGLFAEFRQKTMGFLDQKDDFSVDDVRETVESVLTHMGLRDPNSNPPLFLLIGISEFLSAPQLLIFNGRAVYFAEARINPIGCGDSSVIDYLAEHLYSPDLSENQGIALGAYLIKQATKYIDYCGEPIDVIHGDAGGFQVIDRAKITAGVQMLENEEQYLSTLFVQKPFQL
jgi:hypothetical protein